MSDGAGCRIFGIGFALVLTSAVLLPWALAFGVCVEAEPCLGQPWLGILGGAIPATFVAGVLTLGLAFVRARGSR